MQLHIARLCLDCNEIHDSETCPLCGSGAFAYLSKWVPAPERRQRPRPTSSPEATVYRELIEPVPVVRRPGRLLRGTALGLAAFAAASWIWRQGKERHTDTPEDPAPPAGVS